MLVPVLVPSMHNIYLPQVKICPECQKMNRKIDRERPELHPVPVKSPWYHLGIDFIGPISPVSRSGNRFILTVSDYFTKFAYACALPTKEASGVVASLKQVCFVIMLNTSFYFL